MALHPTLGSVALLLGILIAVPAVSADQPSEKIISLDAKGVTLAMAGIPAGTFSMGTDPTASRYQRDEGPVTIVHITRPFWLGRTELTQAQWEAMDMPNNSYHRGANRPVTNATWEQAMEFCRRLNKRERMAGRLPDGYVYTLPTEAQWEYACRAGANGDYAGELDELGWYSGNSEGETHPVAQKRPNAWGLYDMHGNVLEWCRDWYGSYAGGQRDDPKGVSEGSVRVIRGGSWGYGAVFCRSAYRVRLRPDSRWVILGLRVALTPAEPKPWWDFRSNPENRPVPVTADNSNSQRR
jgi:formylglycine-generating enzyme required for sulfatase activity